MITLLTSLFCLVILTSWSIRVFRLALSLTTVTQPEITAEDMLHFIHYFLVIIFIFYCIWRVVKSIPPTTQDTPSKKALILGYYHGQCNPEGPDIRTPAAFNLARAAPLSSLPVAKDASQDAAPSLTAQPETVTPVPPPNTGFITLPDLEKAFGSLSPSLFATPSVSVPHVPVKEPSPSPTLVADAPMPSDFSGFLISPPETFPVSNPDPEFEDHHSDSSSDAPPPPTPSSCDSESESFVSQQGVTVTTSGIDEMPSLRLPATSFDALKAPAVDPPSLPEHEEFMTQPDRLDLFSDMDDALETPSINLPARSFNTLHAALTAATPPSQPRIPFNLKFKSRLPRPIPRPPIRDRFNCGAVPKPNSTRPHVEIDTSYTEYFDPESGIYLTRVFNGCGCRDHFEPLLELKIQELADQVSDSLHEHFAKQIEGLTEERDQLQARVIDLQRTIYEHHVLLPRAAEIKKHLDKARDTRALLKSTSSELSKLKENHLLIHKDLTEERDELKARVIELHRTIYEHDVLLPRAAEIKKHLDKARDTRALLKETSGELSKLKEDHLLLHEAHTHAYHEQKRMKGIVNGWLDDLMEVPTDEWDDYDAASSSSSSSRSAAYSILCHPIARTQIIPEPCLTPFQAATPANSPRL